MIIDKVYLINLDINKDRLKLSDIQFKKIGGIFSKYKRISAINAKSLSKKYIKNITSPSTYYYTNNKVDMHYQISSIGAIGCALSHIKVWKDMIVNNYKNVIIMEDDFNCLTNSDTIFEYINNLPQDYKIAYLYYHTKSHFINFTNINKYWNTSNNLFIIGAVSYVINIELVRKLLKKSLPINTHIDFYMNYYCLNNNIKRLYPNKQILFGHNFNIKSMIGHKNNFNVFLNHNFIYYRTSIIILLVIIGITIWYITIIIIKNNL